MTGTYQHTLDAKGRLFIPARFRENIGEEFVLFKSPDKCIYIYDNANFEKLVDQVKMLSRTPKEREMQRHFFASAITVTMDKQGRFTVPQDFIDYASLGTEVVLTGEAIKDFRVGRFLEYSYGLGVRTRVSTASGGAGQLGESLGLIHRVAAGEGDVGVGVGLDDAHDVVGGHGVAALEVPRLRVVASLAAVAASGTIDGGPCVAFYCACKVTNKKRHGRNVGLSFFSSEPDLAVVVEDGLTGGHLLVVELHGRVVHLGVLTGEQTDDLGAGPDGGPVAVGGHDVDGTVGIERGVEAHAGADADALDLAAVVDGRGDGMPAQQGDGAVDLGVEPSLADGVGQTGGVDGGGRRLEIGVGAVEQLVPEAVVVLQGGESLGVAAQQLHDLGPLGMVGGQHVEHLAEGQDGPSVGASPEEGGVGLHGLDPSVAEELALRHPHALGKLDDLSGGLVVVFRVARQPAHVGHGGYAHEHVVEPDGVLLRAKSGEGAVGQAVLAVHDVVDVVVNE